MKIVFEKLQTSSKNVYVDFGDGTWQPYPVNEARTNGINIPTSCKDYSKIKIKGSAEIFPNMDVITGIKRYEKVGTEDVIISMEVDTYSNNEIRPTYGNYSSIYNSKNDLYIELGGQKYRLSEIQGHIYSAYDNKYIKVADNKLLRDPHNMDFFVLENLDNELIFTGTHIVSDNGEDTPYYYIGENDKYLMQSSLGSDYFTAGKIYIDMENRTIDKNSPGLQNLADLGSYSIVDYDSGSSHLYVQGIEGINEYIDGTEILEPMGELFNQYLYIDKGSGNYEKTNLKLKFN